MIEGLIVAGLLAFALIGLHLWNKPKNVIAGNLPPVTVKVPMPEVKTPRQPAASTKYGVPYGSIPVKTPEKIQEEREEREWIRSSALRQQQREEDERRARRLREEEEDRRRQERYDDIAYDSTPDLITTAVTAAAAVIVAEALYDSFVDTSPTQEYSSPTPAYESSYSEPSSSYDSPSSWSE